MKSEILYGHRMQMYTSEENAKYWVPKAEWEDIRRYRRVEDEDDLRAQLAEREREIVRLKDIIERDCTAVESLRAETTKLQSRHDSLNDFVTWLEAFTRTRGYPTGIEWTVIEAKLKEALSCGGK